MGVDLKNIITSTSIKLSNLADKTIAIDAYNTIYQFLAIIRGPIGESLTNNNGQITSHLSGLFYRNINFLSNNIKLVYIFDGKPSQLKMKEIERRRKIKEDTKEKYQEALDDGRLEDAKKYSQGTVELSDEIIQQSKYLLELFGIPHIQAESDGEALASNLTTTGKVFACASQDYDSLLFGAKRLIRNLTISGRRKIPNRNKYVGIEPEIIYQTKILETTKLNLDQLIDVGILIGTDFNPGGFAGIGPKTALKLIRENGKLEKINKIREKLKDIPYQEIREIFLNESSKNYKDIKFNFNRPDHDKISKFLCDKMNFSHERVSSSLDKLKKIEEQRSQSLERWF
ncbi:MAG: flap endonuclease-1 [Nitrososphaeraceae archaeon]